MYRKNSQCSVDKQEILSRQKKIFREIKYLVTFLVKMLLSRNFCQKVWENFLISTQCGTTRCGKMRNYLSPKKIFREINDIVTSLVKMLLSRNFCQKVWENFLISIQCGTMHSVKMKNLLSPNFFRQIKYSWTLI